MSYPRKCRSRYCIYYLRPQANSAKMRFPFRSLIAHQAITVDRKQKPDEESVAGS